MSPGSMEKTVERALEVEVSKDSLSFMAWIRIPADSDSLCGFLKFLNMLGGSGVVATDAERVLLKDMRDICEEQQRERAREIELSVRRALSHL